MSQREPDESEANHLRRQHWFILVMIYRESRTTLAEFCQSHGLDQLLFEHWNQLYEAFYTNLCSYLINDVHYSPGMIHGVAQVCGLFCGLEDPASDVLRLRIFLERLATESTLLLPTPSHCLASAIPGLEWKLQILAVIHPPKPNDEEDFCYG